MEGYKLIMEKPFDENKVSFIVPTYNRRDFLHINLSTLTNQSHKNIEIIVINDCGEDVSDVINSFNDNRIKYIVNENNLGLAGSRNVGLKNVTGDWVSFIDDDDGATPIFAEMMLRSVLSSKFNVAYCDSVRMHQRPNELGGYDVFWRDVPYSISYDPDLLLVMNISPVNCFMIKRECFDNVPLFDETVHVYEDYLMNIELSLKYEFLHIPIPLVFHTWRENGSTMSSSRDFTTPMPGIYKRYAKHAINKEWVYSNMNAILKARGQEQINFYELG